MMRTGKLVGNSGGDTSASRAVANNGAVSEIGDTYRLHLLSRYRIWMASREHECIREMLRSYRRSNGYDNRTGIRANEDAHLRRCTIKS
jgi:hypothetical protein